MVSRVYGEEDYDVARFNWSGFECKDKDSDMSEHMVGHI